MPNFPGSPRFASATAWLAVLASLSGALGARSQTNDKAPAGMQDQAPFQLKVASNLVVVRVVVRDAQGKPVEGLKKGDFRLFDNGKEQSITQFEIEKSESQPSGAAPTGTPSTTVGIVPAIPQRFVALYFDDLNTTDADLIEARDAANHFFAANLPAKERVAIFTSETMLSDFTADPEQIRAALAKIHGSANAVNHEHGCPEFADKATMLDEAIHRCGMPDNDATADAIDALWRRFQDQTQMQARSTLLELEQVVKYISQMPGQRTIVLASPGFPSQSEQMKLDEIVDQALRSQVVISSLDPRGLALLMREADVTKYVPPPTSGLTGYTHLADAERERAATDVLAEVAQGTGGEFFHNNNDLQAGFGALAGSPVYYILAFAPTDAKPNGKFHALKVTLAEKAKGVSVQARRGYFALKEGADSEVETRPAGTSDPEAQIEERIRETTLSKTDMRELPVELRTEISKRLATTNELSLLAHLDAKALHFHKEGDRNQNTVTFVSVVFDGSGNYVAGQQRQAKVDLASNALPNLLAAGMSVKMTFQLKPGSYTIREVVTDSEEHLMTAFSRNVTVP